MVIKMPKVLLKSTTNSGKKNPKRKKKIQNVHSNLAQKASRTHGGLGSGSRCGQSSNVVLKHVPVMGPGLTCLLIAANARLMAMKGPKERVPYCM